ncbi:hypothetical protein [Yoonia vestfoldensis]|uniref:hypothetical protein n=1 Tax=Yoonia vestfoldensis TaxID=245188 RepID=UPI000375E1E6|nr:hypothetical protein [Yoonia vestfoldensis]
MRDTAHKDDFDIEHMVALIGAPPAAPMVVVRQDLERARAHPQHGFFPRLLGVLTQKAGQ